MGMESTTPVSLADRLLLLRRFACDHLLEEDWQKLASLTATEAIVNGHNPPLGRMNWGEDAYDVLVLRVLEEVAACDENNVAIFEEYAENCRKQAGTSPFSKASLLRVEAR